MSRNEPQIEGQRESTAQERGRAAVLESPTLKMFAVLEMAYGHFNEYLFERELPVALLNLSRSSGTCKHSATLAFFKPKAWRGAVSNICEVSMAPITTALGPEDYYSTLVHEMAHFLDDVRGVKPKSPGYHGQAWWTTMEQIGLPPVPQGKNRTSRIKVYHRIKPDGPYAGAFKELPREALLPFVSMETGLVVPAGDGEDGEKSETKQGKRARYECSGACGTTMRGPSGRILLCGACQAPYVETGF